MKILKVKCLAPTRLDNYLMQQFPALNPGRLNKALRENKIKLNGKKQPLSTRVMAGDEIKLFILDDVLDADKRVDGPAWKNARGPAQVVYDCPQILIVNKPAGLAVDGPDDDTLLNRALLYLNQQGEYKENDVYTPALCHRLDTGTSGLVIIAKTPEAEELFLAAIKSREVKKTYLCVTFGRPTPPDATLGGYLLKDADRGIVKIVEDKQPGAKDVETRYETIAVSGRLAPLTTVTTPQRLILEVSVNNRKNDWNIWVYPTVRQAIPHENKIYMTDRLDTITLNTLEKGGTVLLSLKKGSLSKKLGGDIQIGFSSIFWNTAWTAKQAPHTLGILCNPAHPALSEFPTEYHSDYQWWDAMSHSGAIEFSKLSPKIHPIVRVINDWFTNRPLALLFEARVGKGKILVSGIDFWQDMDKRPEARQQLYSLKKYMNSPAFHPDTELKREQIQQLL